MFVKLISFTKRAAGNYILFMQTQSMYIIHHYIYILYLHHLKNCLCHNINIQEMDP